MNTLSGPRSLLATSLFALGLATSLGCSGVVTRGGDGGDGGGGGAGGTTATTASQPAGGAGGDQGCDPAACPTPAVAMDDYMFHVTIDGAPSPDIQHLIYGTGYGTPECFAPHGDYSQCGGSTVDIRLPADKLAPGTYSLVYNESGIDMFIEETQDEGGGMCSGAAAGSLDSGTLTIHYVDDATVSFTVDGVPPIMDKPVNGDFQASRCTLEY